LPLTISETTELVVDGTQMNANYLTVLEDVLEVGQYPFTSLSMRKCMLTDKEMGIIAPMMESNTVIKKVGERVEGRKRGNSRPCR